MKRVILIAIILLVLALAATALAQLAAGWSQTDIGGASPAGSASYDLATNTWTVTGDGADIWLTSDSFHFVHRRLRGDGTMTARVVSIAGAGLDEWAKAGVMVRETLNADSKQAMTVMTRGSAQNHAAQFAWRSITGGGSNASYGGSWPLPFWVRIERIGNTFRGYISPNGSNWTQQGTAQTISMSQDVYIGMVVLSHVQGQLCTAKFDNVSVQGELVDKAISDQGRLLDGDVAADGLYVYDMQFSLYDAPVGGNQKGQTVTIEEPRWLQTAIRPRYRRESFAVQGHRQRIAPTPYALYAFSGAGMLKEHTNTGHSSEKVTSIPIATNDLPPTFHVLYSQKLRDLKEREVLLVLSEWEATNDEAAKHNDPLYNVQMASYITLGDSPTDTTRSESREITEANGYNITPGMHHGVGTKVGTFVVPAALTGTKYVNVVVYAASSRASPGDTLTIMQEYGRLSVLRFEQ